MTEGKVVTTSILPQLATFYELPGKQVLDYEALCCFVATGFFLDDDTHFKNKKAYRPSTHYLFDSSGKIIKSEKTYYWNYSPREVPFSQVVGEFAFLLEKSVADATEGKRVILPLSGGLDSRTLAAAVNHKQNVTSYSYELANGPEENKFGASVAHAAGLQHTSLIIPPGYLWNHLPSAARINQCYSDFINPRQIAVLDQVKDWGDVFLLGHWGDVLFDDMGVGGQKSATNEQLVQLIRKKILKPSGVSLAQQLWEAWGLPGSFDTYIDEKLGNLLAEIKIDNVTAKIRAFKSLHWAPRWTSSGLTFFSHFRPMALPYYEDAMCEFICSVPEEYLAGRRIQIEYLKRKNEAIAKVPWQKFQPCNLYNYDRFESPAFLARRAFGKGKRLAAEVFLGRKSGKRNWELQYTGPTNTASLKGYLFDSSFSGFIPKAVTQHVYDLFREAPAENVHAISMLLTLSLFNGLFLQGHGQ